MRLATVALSTCLLAIVASQGIVYNSKICSMFSMGATTKTEIKNKYKTMITNLNKDTTLKAQKTRAINFLNTNWKSIDTIFDKDVLAQCLSLTASMIESRWRITTYLKGLLTKLKAKLADAKFTETANCVSNDAILCDCNQFLVKNLLWKYDKDQSNNAYYFYEDWKEAMLAAIPAAAKKTEISAIVAAHEKANPDFDSDKMKWLPGKGFNKCGFT